MIKKIDIEKEEETQAILNLQRTSYQVEAKLIGSYEIPPLKENLNDLQICGETFYGYFIKDILVGALSYKKVDKVLDIHRLMVPPHHFRKGLAGTLLNYLVQIDLNIDEMVVSTGAENTPAKSLYKRLFKKSPNDKLRISALACFFGPHVVTTYIPVLKTAPP